MGIAQSVEIEKIVKKKRELKTFTFKHYSLKETLNNNLIILRAGFDEIVLNKEVVKELLPHLQRFAETGEL